MDYKVKMKCNVVAHFADQGSEVVMVLSQGQEAQPNDPTQGSLNVKMAHAMANQFVPGMIYEITVTPIAVDTGATH